MIEVRQLLEGTVIDERYRIERRLGAGGMGSVFLARHIALDQPVAIKILRPDLIVKNEMVERFRREARILARLDHEGIVRLTDAGRHDGKVPYLVMEYVEGITLQAKLKAVGRVSARDTIGVMIQLCDALAHAHESGTVHRDLKPANVLIRGDGTMKIADFGVARLIALDSAGGPALTQTGLIIGTPSYLAPEQALGKTIDGRTDLYALGVLAYRMLAGELPFRGSLQELLRAHLKDVPRRLEEMTTVESAKEVGPLFAIVHQLLEKKPEGRPDSALTLKTELLKAAEESFGKTEATEANLRTIPFLESADFTAVDKGATTNVDPPIGPGTVTAQYPPVDGLADKTALSAPKVEAAPAKAAPPAPAPPTAPMSRTRSWPLSRRSTLAAVAVAALGGAAVLGFLLMGSEVDRIRAQIDRGAHMEARAELNKFAKANPDRRGDAYFLDGYLAWAKLDPGRAARSYQKALELAPKDYQRNDDIFDHMVRALEAESCSVRSEAARTLALLRDSRARGPLERAIARDEEGSGLFDGLFCRFQDVARETLAEL